jgi:Leucine-rich repeat (LRR) protein
MLEFFSVQMNQFSGIVPQAMYNMSRLQTIILTGNGNLTGTFPVNQSFNLPMLQIISLDDNNFFGRFPAGLQSCQYLKVIDLGGNLFMDVIPTWLDKLPYLQQLFFGFASLIGSIPAALSNLTSLTDLDLSNGYLKGEIPQELGLMPEVSYMYLGGNQVPG